jgi:hypothetical protein
VGLRDGLVGRRRRGVGLGEDEGGVVVGIVPTSAQRRLCRAADYADPGVTVLLTGVSGQEVSA